jgi:NAD(P)H dehydrogenase (quinone)
LENPEPHDRQIYPLYGPVEMNHYQIADAISKTLGIPVRYEPLEVATFAEGLKAKGFPSHLVQHLSNVAVDYQNGIFAGTNNLVEVIGNRTPMTVEDYVNANKEAFSKDGRYAIAICLSTSSMVTLAMGFWLSFGQFLGCFGIVDRFGGVCAQKRKSQ